MKSPNAPLPLLFGMLLVACGPKEPAGTGASSGASTSPVARNVLVFSIDTLRADLLGTYGRSPSPTPNIDAFAAGALVFDAAYSQATLTNPALTSMLTGLVPPQHGVHEQSSGFASGVLPIPVLLQASGIATGSFIANMCKLQDTSGTVFHDGWDHQFCGMMDAEDAYFEQFEWDKAVVDATASWIAEQDGPWFAWAHLMDPHAEHRPAKHLWDWEGDPPLERIAQYRYYNAWEELREIPPDNVLDRLWDLYTAQVRGADEQFGRLMANLEQRGLLENTAIVFTSDHGEELFETWSRFDHGFSMTEGVFHVPLLVRAPGLEPGRLGDPVELLQVAPTLLELFDVEAPYTLPAPSLLHEQPSRGYAFSFGGKVSTSIRTPTERFWRRHQTTPFTRDVAAWRTEAPWFELQQCLARYGEDGRTPKWADLSKPKQARLAGELLATMEEFYASQKAFGEGVTIDDPELRASLERLGYLGYEDD